MSDSPDIVARLRCITWMGSDALCQEAADEIERLRAERDEARREICNIVAGKQGKRDNFSPDAIEHATLREWDCFNTPAPQVKHTLRGIVSEVRKAQPPVFESEE
jgi:hypothetical protein